MTPEELQGMAEHVQYEIDEFRNAIRKLAGLKESGPDWNSRIELLLLHFRNLRDFFLDTTRIKDDVLARDYVDSWNPKPDPIFDQTREAINKRLAHLTLTRLWPWNPPLKEMNGAIESIISDFKQDLTPEQARWFPRLDSPAAVVLAVSNYSTHTVSHSGIFFFDR